MELWENQKRAIERIKEDLNFRKLFLITGEPLSGKTTVLKAIRDFYKNRYRVIYFSAHEFEVVPFEKGLLPFLAKELKVAVEFIKVREALLQDDLLIIIDEADDLPKQIGNFFRWLGQENQRIIVATYKQINNWYLFMTMFAIDLSKI